MDDVRAITPTGTEPCELRDHLFGQSIAEVVILLLSLSEVFEGQHNQHQSCRNSFVAQSSDRLKLTDKAVTPLRNRLNKLLGPLFSESLAQLRDVRSQAPLLYNRGGPH